MDNKAAPGLHSPPVLLSCTRAEVPLSQSWCPQQGRWRSSTGRGYRESRMKMDLLAPARRRWSSPLDQRGSLSCPHLQHFTKRAKTTTSAVTSVVRNGRRDHDVLASLCSVPSSLCLSLSMKCGHFLITSLCLTTLLIEGCILAFAAKVCACKLSLKTVQSISNTWLLSFNLTFWWCTDFFSAP